MDLTHSGIETKRGKPVSLPKREGNLQRKLIGMRVKEGGKSECSFVMKEIEVTSQGNMTSRENGQTSTWSLITRKQGKPIKEEKQMTVEQTGASSHRGGRMA